MSDQDLYDEPSEAPSSEETPVEDGQSTSTDERADVTEFTIGDRKFNIEDVKDVIEHHGTWKEMQAAHTRRSQALADERRALEREREKLEEERKQSSMERSNPPDDEDDVVSKLVRTNREILERLDLNENRYQETMAQVHKDEEMEIAVSPYRTKPLFNEKEVLEYLDANGLDHRHVGVAYNALYSYRIGETIGEGKAASRYRAPVMGSTGSGGVSPEWTSAADAPAERPSISQTSWEDLEREATEDQKVG